MTKKFRPLLASKLDLAKVKYPVLVSPKLDGIRCLMIDGEAVSRNLKPIPNDYIRNRLRGLPNFDGELMVNGDFNKVQSSIMKKAGEPDFYYNVFDIHSMDAPFHQRLEYVERTSYAELGIIVPVPHYHVDNEDQLLEHHHDFIFSGQEGTMVRDPNGIYKQGRSTVNQGILLKLKDFDDSEAEIVDILERRTNNNEKTVDECGYAKRSSHKANMVPAGTAGMLLVKWMSHEFKIGFGPGLTDKGKQEIWDRRAELRGRTIKFSYQGTSKDGIPRFGKMIGYREDME